MTQLRNTKNVNVLDTAMGDIRRQAESSNFTNIETFIGAVNSALNKASSEINSGSGSGDTEGLFESMDKLRQLEDGQTLNFFNHSSNLFGCHCSYLQ